MVGIVLTIAFYEEEKYEDEPKGARGLRLLYNQLWKDEAAVQIRPPRPASNQLLFLLAER